MFKEIPKSDIVTRPFKVYKEWTLDENDVRPVFGEDHTNSFIDLDNEVPSEGFNKKVVYATIKQQFYNNPSTASIFTENGRRKSYASTDERNIGSELVVLSIPQEFYGEGIKIGSVTLTDNSTSKVYTDDSFSNLLDSGSNVAGNIFYDKGIVVLTRDIVSGSVMGSYFLNFRSTKTIYENEIFLSVLETEFNFSQNPSACYNVGASKTNLSITHPTTGNLLSSSFYNEGVKYIRTAKYPFTSSLNPNKFGSFDDYEVSGSIDPTGSYLAPYITTIGLYDDNMDLLVVAKLPQPIKSLPDYPVNFIVRFDT